MLPHPQQIGSRLCLAVTGDVLGGLWAGVLCPPRTQGSYSSFPLFPSALRPSRGGRGRAGGSSGILGSRSSPAWRERAGCQLPGDPKAVSLATQYPNPLPRARFSCVPQTLQREGAGTWVGPAVPAHRQPLSRGKVNVTTGSRMCPSAPGDDPGAGPAQEPARGGGTARELRGLFGGSRSSAGAKGASRP